jgi:hypothetical protein
MTRAELRHPEATLSRTFLRSTLPVPFSGSDSTKQV